jgi:serine/threonine-protein kinase
MTDAKVPSIGDVLAGKYRVERVMGVGGMGVVLAALHLQLDERVAIKLILQGAASEEAVARFLREGKAAVKIRSEHVARVFDVGTLESGAPFMVMEYLEGKDLSQVLEQDGTVPVPTAIGYVLQACEALAEAHALGIIHRDLKPANLFLTSRADGSPCIKVLDFGISKTAAGAGPSAAMTSTSAVMGSPLYMSPEQMRASRNVDVRADIWALGTILHELVTGDPPFMAASMPELCAMILEEPAPSIRQSQPNAPPALEAAILRCLAKKPDARYANIAELAAGIVEFGPPEGQISLGRVTRVLRVTTNRAPSDPAISALASSTAAQAGPPSVRSASFGGAPGGPPSAATGAAPAFAGPASSGLQVPGQGAVAARTSENWAATGGAGVPKRSNVGLIVGAAGAGVVLLALVVGGLVTLASRRHAPAPPAAASSVPEAPIAASSPPAVAPPSMAASTAPVETAASASPAADAPASAAAAPSAAVARTPSTGARAAKPPSAPTNGARPKASASPSDISKTRY